MADKKRVPLGKPLPLTSAELTEAAKITEEDIERAKKFWRMFAPDGFVDLLDAETVEDDEQ